jgi:hypothetical protein
MRDRQSRNAQWAFLRDRFAVQALINHITLAAEDAEART